MRDIRLLSGPLDPNAALDALSDATPNAGGIASFTGKVRAGDDVEALELSHYEPLTLAGMDGLADDAFARFDLMGLVMLHRTGLLTPGEPIVFVAAASKHRRDAIAATDFAMDHLKSAAWFWKREKRGARWHWIEPRDQDFSDKARWE
ncbi:MAG: molybdenum cofactor biosynthesis protein MoaE [Erythrobacter sp.]